MKIDSELIMKLMSMPPPDMKKDIDYTSTSGQLKCACKKKDIAFEEVSMVQTQFIRGTDRTCQECMRDYFKGWSRVICAGCKDVVIWMAPGRDDDGFLVESGKTYHALHCPECEPDKYKKTETGYPIVEKATFLSQKHGLPISHWYK